MNGTRVLVTGARGFIGRWSVPPLLAAGHEVHAVVSQAACANQSATPQLQGALLHQADLLDEAQLDRLMADVRPTHLLHFAWVATPGLYWHSPDNQRWLAASVRLLQQFHAHGGRRAVMAGSCAEYDWAQVSVCDETASPLADAGQSRPSEYAACKIAMQRALAGFSAATGLSSAWGRVFFQFGPYEHPGRLVPSVILSLLGNEEARCSDGRQVRSFLHVADVGAAFAAILDSDVQGPVNVGSEERIALAALIDDIAARLGKKQLVRLGARPAGAEPALLIPDARKLREVVGWRPSHTLESGIADTIAWWRAQGPS